MVDDSPVISVLVSALNISADDRRDRMGPIAAGGQQPSREKQQPGCDQDDTPTPAPPSPIRTLGWSLQAEREADPL